MRLTILLPLCFVFAGSAHAQTHGITGIHVNVPTSMVGPVTGFDPIDFYSPNSGSRLSRDFKQAQGLIAVGQYAQADDMLSILVGRTSDRQVRFLKGIAKLGLGDAGSARRYFEQSLYRGRNGYPGAMSGLALAEIQLGNRDAAHKILEKLRDQREKCGRSCDRAQPLGQAVSVIEKALA